jgi:hypothetical protein
VHDELLTRSVSIRHSLIGERKAGEIEQQPGRF